MNLPVLRNELVLLLRRPWLFLALGVVFLSLTLCAALLSRGILNSLNRDAICRGLFYSLVTIGYIGFSFHAGRVAAQSTGKDRDRGTSVFLRTAPIRGWSVVGQKMVMSLLVEWFVFIGLIPFLSLLFLVGGIDMKEFLYQLTCLVVWINTCVMLGLVVGLGVRNGATADRIALGQILGLGMVPYGMMLILDNLKRYVLPDTIFHAVWRGLNETCTFLVTLSPMWMSMSWLFEIGGRGNPFPGSEFPYLIFPSCPALLSWSLHIALQILLFAVAVYLWRNRGEAPVRKQAEGVDGIPARRRIHALGWRAFFKQERSQMFVNAKWPWLILVLFIAAGALAGIYSTGVELPAVTACFVLISLISSLFFSQSAFSRDVRRGTAPLLLIAPAPRREMTLGKWLFYQSVGWKLLLPGVAYTCALIARAEYYAVPNAGDIWTHLTYYFIGAAALPLTSIIGILMGLSSFPLYYALPIALGAICLFPVTIVLFLGWIFQQLWLTSSDGNETETQPERGSKGAKGVLAVFGLFAVVLGFALGLGPADPTFRRATGETLLILNAAVILPAVGVALWSWLYTRTETWWKEKLLPSEYPYASLARNFEFLRDETKRNSRYRAHILRMAAQAKKSVDD